MADSIEIEIVIDDSDLKESQKNIEEHNKEAKKILAEIEKKRRKSFNHVLNMARASYLIGIGVVKAMGISVPYMFRSMISASFATIAALKAVALGKAMTTMDWISFAMEMGQLGLATAATVAAQVGQQEIGRSLMGAKMSLMGISTLISNLYFL